MENGNQVDVIYWICESFWQCKFWSVNKKIVVVKSLRPKDIEITSGDLQGTHLEPILFNLYINDIATSFKNYKFTLFADGLKMYKNISNLSHSFQLPRDFDCLLTYCKTNDLNLNVKKCNIINFTRKYNSVSFDYMIKQETLKRPHTIPDLGIHMDTKLSFNYQFHN